MDRVICLALPDQATPPTWEALRAALLAATPTPGEESGDTFGPGDACYAARLLFRPGADQAVVVGTLVLSNVTDLRSFQEMPRQPSAPLVVVQSHVRGEGEPPAALIERLLKAARALGYAPLPAAAEQWLRNVDHAHSEAWRLVDPVAAAAIEEDGA